MTLLSCQLMEFGSHNLTKIDVGLTLLVNEYASSSIHRTPTTLPHIEGSVISVQCE